MGSVVQGQVRNAGLCRPLEQIVVQALDKNGRGGDQCLTDENGRWAFAFSKAPDALRFEKEGYVSKTVPWRGHSPLLVRLLEEGTIGYLDKLWCLPGEFIDASIHSPSSYDVRLCRFGYGVKKILDLGEYPPVIQRVPDRLFVDTGLSWSRVVTTQIPEDATPGIYGLLLSPRKGEPYCITFLVSTPPGRYGKENDCLVLVSTNNWQTYNWWGGRSRYINHEAERRRSLKGGLHTMAMKYLPESLKPLVRKCLGKRIVVSVADHPDDWQFQPLSIRRPHPDLSIPTDEVTSPFYEHLAQGEWRVLAWLEREKIGYDIVSGYELHRRPELLQNYKTIILSTHCEYWSREMYAGLKSFHARGGSILNLSGNSIYREIEYLDDCGIRCVSLRFAQTVEDESSLLGVRFDYRGYMTAAPYTVRKPDHWVFRGTGVKRGDLFAKSSLNRLPSFDGGSGWETDKITKTAPKDTILLAKGTNPKNGGADMIIIEQQNGSGLVFSASSITFGGSLLIDDVSSRIVVNLLSRIREYSNEA